MASNPNNPRSFRDRLWRGVTIGTIGTLGITGIAACSNGEAQAEKPPVTQSAEPTPGPTKSAPVETQKPIESLVGAIDTTNLSPEAVAFANTVTPEALYKMSADERTVALTISPEMYNGNTEVLADLQFAQFAAMMGLANNSSFIDEARNTQGWLNIEAYVQYGNDLVDSVYGSPVSKYSPVAAGSFAEVAMRTEGVKLSRETTTGAAAAVGDYKVVFSKVDGKPTIVGGDTVSSSADVEFKFTFDAPVDFTDLVNDPNSMNSGNNVLGTGVPESHQITFTASDVLERGGAVAPTAIIVDRHLLDLNSTE